MLARTAARISAGLLFAPLLLNAGFSIKPTVNIVAVDAYAHEDPAAPLSGLAATSRDAVFLVSRGSASARSLTVFYEIRGTASNGADYYPLHGTVTIRPGQRSARIVVEPIPDVHPEPDPKTVILRLKPASSYTVGPRARAKAFVADYAVKDYSGFVGPGQGRIGPR